jgi:hypothetical protein
MTGEIVQQSNVFGVTTTSSSQANVEPANSETTAAGKLIAHLRFVADSAIDQAANRANWLGIAGNQGQNTDPKSMVKGELLKPNPLTRTGALSSWTLPAIAASPLNLPPVPDNLKVDWQKLSSDTKADIEALRTSWLTKFLPDATDVTALSALFSGVLNGSTQAAAEAKLNGLEDQLLAALSGIIDSTRARLDQQFALVKSNITANSGTAATGVTDALTLAKDNSTNIAWARGRDQAAREAARQEAEAVTRWAASGFTLPGGALVAMQAKARQATLNAASDLAAQQAEKQQQMFFDVARANVESFLRLMDARSNADITAYKVVNDSDLRFAELQLNANTAKVKMAFDHLGLTLDFTKFSAELATKYRLGVIEGLNDLIRAYAALKGNETAYLEAISRSQLAAQTAVLDYYRAALGAAELGMKVDLTNNENDLRWATIAAQFIGTSVGHHVSAASAAADVFARTAAMALSGLNGIASLSAQG